MKGISSGSQLLWKEMYEMIITDQLGSRRWALDRVPEDLSSASWTHRHSGEIGEAALA